MNNETYQPTNSLLHTWFAHPWLRGESKRTMIFDLPLNVVKQRLSNAFTNTITESNGFFFPKFSYSAQIFEEHLELQYHKSGRSGIPFNMTGYFSVDQQGTKLEITVKNSFYAYLQLVFSIVLVVVVSFLKKEWPLFLIIALIIFGQVGYNRSEAADLITTLFDKIVANAAR